MSVLSENNAPLNNLQLELLKCLKHLASEEQIKEVKSLLRNYFAEKLDLSFDKLETENKYSEAIYESWLKNERLSQ